MANEFARNQKDYGLMDAAITLPASATTTYSDDFDLGLDDVKPENMELEIKIPTIPVSVLANAATLIVTVYNGAAASPTTVLASAIETVTGATATDPSVARVVRYPIPSDALRYLRVGFALSAGNASATTYDCSAHLCF